MALTGSFESLAFRADMRAALTDDQTFDGRAATQTGLAGTMENVEFVLVTSLPVGNGIEVRLAVSQRCALVIDSFLKNHWDGAVKRPDFPALQRR